MKTEKLEWLIGFCRTHFIGAEKGLDEAAAELSELRRENERLTDMELFWKEENRNLEEENERLREALERHGSHAMDCPKCYDGADECVCTCGLDAALRASQPEQPKEEV